MAGGACERGEGARFGGFEGVVEAWDHCWRVDWCAQAEEEAYVLEVACAGCGVEVFG